MFSEEVNSILFKKPQKLENSSADYNGNFVTKSASKFGEILNSLKSKDSLTETQSNFEEPVTLENASSGQSLEQLFETSNEYEITERRTDSLGNLKDTSPEDTDAITQLFKQQQIEAKLLTQETLQSYKNVALHSKVQELINNKGPQFANEPIFNLDKQNLKLSIDFPSLEDLKNVKVEYDPLTRSITAEMVTSQEAMNILQKQVKQLEDSLAKHDIKLKALKIVSSEEKAKDEQNKDNDAEHERRRRQQQDVFERV